MADAPIELKWNIDLRVAPQTPEIPPKYRGRPIASSSLIWTGDCEAGKSYLQRAVSLCEPEFVRNRVMPFLDLQTMADSSFPHGERYYTKSGYFNTLDDTTIDRLLAAVSSIPSAQTQIELASGWRRVAGSRQRNRLR